MTPARFPSPRAARTWPVGAGISSGAGTPHNLKKEPQETRGEIQSIGSRDQRLPETRDPYHAAPTTGNGPWAAPHLPLRAEKSRGGGQLQGHSKARTGKGRASSACHRDLIHASLTGGYLGLCDILLLTLRKRTFPAWKAQHWTLDQGKPTSSGSPRFHLQSQNHVQLWRKKNTPGSWRYLK